MSDSNERIHRIDQYLVGALDIDKAKEIERLIKEDKEFAELVSERRNLKEGIEHKGREILKNKIKSIHEKSTSSSNGKLKSGSSSKRTLFLILGLLIGLFLIYYAITELSGGKPSIEEKKPEYLYAQYFEPMEMSDIKRSNSMNQEELQLTIEIEKLYADKKYSEVIPLLQTKLSASSNRSSSDLIALGIAYMETNDDDKAMASFNEVLVTKDFNFENDATWYLALIQIRKGDFEQAKITLKPLVEDVNADFHNEAKAIIKKL